MERGRIGAHEGVMVLEDYQMRIRVGSSGNRSWSHQV